MQMNLQTTTPSKKKKRHQPDLRYKLQGTDNLHAKAINHYYLSTCKYLHSFLNLHQDAVEKLCAQKGLRNFSKCMQNLVQQLLQLC